MIVPKSVTPKPKKKSRPSNVKDEGLIIKECADGQISRSHISSIVKAAVKLSQSRKLSQKSGKLFESDGKKIYAQITGIKVPKESRSHMVKCTLPHKVNSASLGVALFVKDLTKNFKDDHEPTVHHFNDMLRSANVKEHIDEVIPLRGLKSEYQTFELKRRLSNKYDKFLADTRIINRLPKHLGKHFFGKNKIPIPVDMEAKDLDAEVKRALHTIILPLTHKGVSSILEIGSTAMNMEHVVDNVLKFVDILKVKYPGGWKNIRSIHIKTESSPSVPLHVSTTSIKDVGYVDAQKPKRKLKEPQIDELSTLPGAKVKVLADGTVKVRRVKDPNWDLDQEEPFVSGSEDEEETEKQKKGEEESKETDKKKKSDLKNTKKRRRDAEAEDIPSKKFKNIDDSDSEDEQMYQNELEFMKKMALEEEEMERRNKEAPADDEVDESKVVVADEDSEEDEDEVAVDDICIKGESTGGGNKSKLMKPSRKERSKTVKSRKKIAKETKSSKKSGPKSNSFGKKSPKPAFKAKKGNK